MTILSYLILTYFAVKFIRFIFKKKNKKQRKSILGKIWILISMRLHRKLDEMIRYKKESLSKNTQQDQKKTVEFKVYKGKKVQ